MLRPYSQNFKHMPLTAADTALLVTLRVFFFYILKFCLNPPTFPSSFSFSLLRLKDSVPISTFAVIDTRTMGIKNAQLAAVRSAPTTIVSSRVKGMGYAPPTIRRCTDVNVVSGYLRDVKTIKKR